MKKQIKFILCFLLLLGGCAKSTPEHPLRLDLFYTSTCPYCHQMRKELFPKLEKKYGDRLMITLHDVDIYEEELQYYNLVGKYDLDHHEFITPTKLLNFDGSIFETYAQEVLYPLLVVDEAYVYFGYNPKFDQLYLDDLDAYLKGAPLGTQESSNERYFIKR